MDDDRWTDRIIGERMQLDRAFTDQVDASQFTRQQWGLIMTAVEFDIEHPDDPDRARLVADTSALPSVMPELDTVARQQPGGQPRSDDRGGGGLIGTIRDALGVGSGDDGPGYSQDDLDAAQSLTETYASELQAKLEAAGKWRQVREAAAESDRDD